MLYRVLPEYANDPEMQNAISHALDLMQVVKPCEHGNYDRHYAEATEFPSPIRGEWCEGAALKEGT